MKAAVIGPRWLRAAVAERARTSHQTLEIVDGADLRGLDVVAYFAADASSIPDGDAAPSIWSACIRAGLKGVVLVSSAAAYGARPENPGLMNETRTIPRRGNPIGLAWRLLERGATQQFQHSRLVLTILRPVATMSPGSKDRLTRLLSSRIAFTVPGHDPTVQLLSVSDLADAICLAIERNAGGIFNIAPDEPITLRAAIGVLGGIRIPIPYSARRGWTSVVRRGRVDETSALDYIRYSWTVSNTKAKRQLGFIPKRTSAEAVAELGNIRPAESDVRHRFDPFGLDERYIARVGRTVLGFLRKYYWRIEVAGLEHLPSSGKAVIVGMHRGFMPLDGVMTLHVIARGTGRIPRFLIHPGVGLRFPFLSNFMTKLGGMIACCENAAYVLDREEILAIYPEGIRGAFTMYRSAYRAGPSWRADFVEMALRHQAPIIPFVTVGSAEIFPILGRIDWRWWKRYTSWPFFPITPTFPLIPLPLPSKWHMQFLPPLHVERSNPPEAADDATVVARISETVKQQIEEAAHRMLQRRRSIFFGSVFPCEAALRERTT
jgi:nucleoside-diphosphate-sugar epimerase/1-acyl-sn-glycerol-3-phosphate acyltransferase